MSAVVLAGGSSKRFGQDKGLIILAEKPLILHVLDKLALMVDDVVLVVNSNKQKMKFAEIAKQRTHIIIDKAKVQTPLIGALAGFKTVRNEYTLLLACDTPFLSTEILGFLSDLRLKKTAVIPRWPNGNIEPLQAIFHAEKAAKAAKAALGDGKLDMRSMISNMWNVRYISTMVLQKFDPQLMTFFNINTSSDLQKAEAIMKHHTY